MISGIVNTVVSATIAAAAGYIGYKIGKGDIKVVEFCNRISDAVKSAKKAGIDAWEASGKPRVAVQQTPADLDDVLRTV